MATMKDVAKLASVSTSTVSHVMNGTRFVSDDIAKRVQDAALQLNYHGPSAVARSLKQNCTKTIGMLVTTSTNPFYAEVVRSVEQACYQQGYNLILCNTEGDAQRLKRSLTTLIERRVDGLIMMCAMLEGDDALLYRRLGGLPVVVMDWGQVDFSCDKIQGHSRQGGILATQYLIDNGHTQIGCITGPRNRQQADLRYQGFVDAMAAANLPINPAWVIESNFETEGGKAAFAQLQAKGELPSALFVCNDMMAIGVLHEAQRTGVQIPQQLSVIGYDNIQLAKFMTPALTSIHQSKARLGAAAVNALIARLHDPSLPPQFMDIEPRVTERASVSDKS
ncbi:LacI family transcriptional regulator [Shewanella sairae]|uniref:LacI family transcriptional regulator n=1 Tax=Shewanella sairae TaxID=190310 RepID=A0ABQ4PM07_9GAMM|nr:substrate-binding domain-containing protein [Shewanella sairae]MCL1131827.1 substrate-binding domain-containing protein [Shewanella sairae]GIU49219.1 LacI family transcriptional regulator [Shewanella sairae]